MHNKYSLAALHFLVKTLMQQCTEIMNDELFNNIVGYFWGHGGTSHHSVYFWLYSGDSGGLDGSGSGLTTLPVALWPLLDLVNF